MLLTQRITQDLVAAQKAQEKIKMSSLRMLRAAIQTAAIEAKPQELDEAGVLQVIRKLIKQRKESIEAFRKGGRQDLVDQETAELAVLEQYMPAAVPPEDIRRAVTEAIRSVGATSAKDFGRVMKQAMASLAGRADGKDVQQVVQTLLTSGGAGSTT